MPSITLSTISHPMTDAARLARAGQQVGAPKIALPNSFILHAPLEFMARAALLAYVEPSGRDAALDRITWLGNTYEAAGDEVSAPDTTGFPWSTAGATARLTAAVSDGDVDGADVAATWMADHLDPVALAGEVTDLVIPALAAAGHGSIFLDLLIRTDPAFAPRRAFRGIARELARTPDWGLSWFVDRNDTADARTAADANEPTGRGVADGRRLLEALVAPESPGDLGSGSIFATMHLTESSGLAERVLGPVLGPIDPVPAARCLRLIAAHSMLQDNPDAAPYGWTHCLTLPQAALGLAPLAARPAQAVARRGERRLVGLTRANRRHLGTVGDLRRGARGCSSRQVHAGLPPGGSGRPGERSRLCRSRSVPRRLLEGPERVREQASAQTEPWLRIGGVGPGDPPAGSTVTPNPSTDERSTSPRSPSSRTTSTEPSPSGRNRPAEVAPEPSRAQIS